METARMSSTSVTDYMGMSLRRFGKVRNALIAVLEDEARARKEAAESRK